MEYIESKCLAKLRLCSFEFATEAGHLDVEMEIKTEYLKPQSARVINFKGAPKGETVAINEEMAFEGVLTHKRGPEYSICLVAVDRGQRRIVQRRELENIWPTETPRTLTAVFWDHLSTPTPTTCFGKASFEFSKTNIN